PGTFFADTFFADTFFAGTFFAGTFLAGTFLAGTFLAGTFFFMGASRFLTAAAFLTVICFFLATGDLPAARGFAALAIVSASRGRKGSRTLHRSRAGSVRAEPRLRARARAARLDRTLEQPAEVVEVDAGELEALEAARRAAAEGNLVGSQPERLRQQARERLVGAATLRRRGHPDLQRVAVSPDHRRAPRSRLRVHA